jgi:hypothetical protein
VELPQTYRWVPIWLERVQFVRAQDLLRPSAPELFDVVCGVLLGVSSLAISILKLVAAAAALPNRICMRCSHCTPLLCITISFSPNVVLLHECTLVIFS